MTACGACDPRLRCPRCRELTGMTPTGWRIALLLVMVSLSFGFLSGVICGQRWKAESVLRDGHAHHP
jgi:hypothetical protein